MQIRSKLVWCPEHAPVLCTLSPPCIFLSLFVDAGCLQTLQHVCSCLETRVQHQVSAQLLWHNILCYPPPLYSILSGDYILEALRF